MKSIFEQIDEVVRLNGFVPAEFKLEDPYKPGEEVPALMGEQEGLLGRPLPKPEDEMLKAAMDVLSYNVKINARLAVHNFDEKELGFSVALIRGHLLKFVIDNIQEFDPHKLSTLSYSLVMFGTKIETVKLGLLLLVLFDFADDEVVKKHLITLGLYEEFTSYVLPNVKAWPENERNHVYYIYSKKLTGWGKINSMELLEPVNDEVREWVLTDGCRNDVSYGYLGLAAFEKCNLIKWLKDGNLNDAQMQGARDIMRGLMEEGPAKGISEVKHPARLAMLYLKELTTHKINLEDVTIIYELKTYIMNKDDRSLPEDKENAVNLLDRLIALSDTENMIKGGLVDNPRLALWIAKEAGIDLSDELMGQLKYNFGRYYKYGYYFMENNLRVNDYINTCEKQLLDKDFREGMGMEPVPADSDISWQIDIVVQYLSAYPGLGEKLINTALNSSVYRYRLVGAKVLKDWEKSEGAGLKKINPELLKTVKKLKKKEVDGTLKKAWDEIVDFKG